MKTRLKQCALLVTALLLSSTNAHAAGLTGSSAKIESLLARDVGMDIYTDRISNPMNCSVANVFRIQPSLPNSEALISTVLTAFTSGKRVAFWVAGCEADGVSIVSAVKIGLP